MDHLRIVYMTSGVLLLVMFGLMTWQVKEGEYPPAPDLIGQRTGFLPALQTYFVECFTSRRYWYYFLAGTMWAVGFSITGLDMFWAQSLGADLNAYGKIVSINHLLVAVLIIPAGVLADKIHPVRIILISKLILVLVMPVAAIFLFYDALPTWAFGVWVALQFVSVPMTALYKAAELPMSMRILPHDRYCQFSSAGEAMKAIAVIIAGPIAGGFIDLMRNVRTTEMWEYRAVPIWSVIFYAFSLVFLWLLYRDLKNDAGSDIDTPAPSLA